MSQPARALARLASSAQQIAISAAYRAALAACGASNNPQTHLQSRARHRAIYLCVMHYSLSRRSVAVAAGISHKQVVHICQSIENQRDDDCALDRHLDDLQLELMA